MTKSFALHPQHAVGQSLRASAQHTLHSAITILQDDSRDDALIIHEFRVEMKRWRALLRLLRPILGNTTRQLNIDARNLARELTGPRDIQSALDAFNSLPVAERSSSKTRTRSPRTIKAITDRLVTLKKTKEAGGLSTSYRERAKYALESAIANVREWDLDNVDFEDVAKSLTATYQRSRRGIPSDWTNATADELHDLRKQVVNHRYQMELIEPLWPRLGQVWVDDAQRLRRRLGQLQDLAVLEQMTRPGKPLAAWRSQLTPSIAARRTDRIDMARQVAVRLFAETPKAFRQRMVALWEANR